MIKAEPLSEKTVLPDPIRQFAIWYAERLSAVSVYPDAVCLATATKNGSVSSRIVLLKDFNESGFVFFTNYNSKKGQQLADNQVASMLFYWPESGRQIRIEGITEKVTSEESDAYFNTRPRDSQIGAWASDQSRVIPDRKYLNDRVEIIRNRFEGRQVDRPSQWGGFRLIPDKIEFWQEGEYRLHDRIQYTRKTGSWYIERLSP